MKGTRLRKVSFNNRKKQFEVVYVSGKRVGIHYSQLGLEELVRKTWIDKETRGRSVGIELTSGKIEYMPYDQPLALSRDADYLLQDHIEVLTAQIKKALKEKRISKRYLAEQLHTSDNQVHRLLNPAILNKNLSQLYRIGSLLGLEVEIGLKAA